ncbi:MAG: hypothetical protein AAFQ80_22865 [Cyanobacteria bacterium J06621_8]
MFGLGAKKQVLVRQYWQDNLSEYVTAVAWSPAGILAASSAAGEVVVWQDGNLVSLLPAGLVSIDCLAFAADGKFLAAGGQDGKVRIWSIPPASGQKEVKLIATLDNKPSWIDKLAWNPTCNHLAFSLGRNVQIWDADTQAVITTLPYANSSVLALAWRPNGENIAIVGNGGIKVWSTKDWDRDPRLIDLSSASIVTVWSRDGKYIASGNLDNTIAIVEYASSRSWVMQGFPGKVSQLSWSQPLSDNAPLLAVSSMGSIAVWHKEADEQDGWSADMLTLHEGKIEALEFHPQSLLLASAAADGLLGLWTKAKQIRQTLKGVRDGFSCLAWSQDGQKLATGGQDGELIIWSESGRGKDFG